MEEAEAALRDYQGRLERAFAENRELADSSIRRRRRANRSKADQTQPERAMTHRASTRRMLAPDRRRARQCPRASPCTRECSRCSTSASRWPQRQIDWAFGELLALGSLLPKAPRCVCPARTPAAAPSSRGTRCSSTARPARSSRRCALATNEDGTRPAAILDVRLAAVRIRRRRLRVRLLGRATPTPSCSGRPSSATSSTAPRSVIDEFISSGEASGASAPRSCCCCRTVTRARAPTTPRAASSASCSCAPRAP